MNPLTRQFLEQLWEGKPTFEILASRLKRECDTISAVEAAVIGRDLILRRAELRTELFRQAAFLASDGEAGNDRFRDFCDCTALLPEDRYRQILSDPDELIDDSISFDFGEHYMIHAITEVFDRALAGEDHAGLLEYLVGGKDEEPSPEAELTEAEVKSQLPRLYAKFGYLLQPNGTIVEDYRARGDTVTLDDLLRGGNEGRAWEK